MGKYGISLSDNAHSSTAITLFLSNVFSDLRYVGLQ